MFHVRQITAALAAVALLCLSFAHADVRTSSTTSVTLKRGSSLITPAPLDMVECESRKAALIALDAITKTSGQAVYVCADNVRTVATFTVPKPVPTCTAPKPAQQAQVQTCPIGTVGTWSQTMDHVAAAYPTCWTPGEWTPASAPAGICATQPPAQLVYACPEAGADGRILESSTVQWPNCPSAALMAPSRALVVAVNTGAQPLYWRLASRLTDERIWAQIGGVGAWTRASVIDWGATVPPPTGSATISWTPPTQNVDDTPLVNLAGHRIVYGTSSTALTNIIDVPNPAVRSYVVERLSPATYYFAVRAYTTTGAESANSNVASKQIQ